MNANPDLRQRLAWAALATLAAVMLFLAVGEGVAPWLDTVRWEPAKAELLMID